MMNIAFLQAALAHALICSIEGEAVPKSREFNRCRAAHESVLKVIDMYLPDGFDETQLNKLYEVLDGPVTELLNSELEKFNAATP